jgi:hypothetical protein
MQGNGNQFVQVVAPFHQGQFRRLERDQKPVQSIVRRVQRLDPCEARDMTVAELAAAVAQLPRREHVEDLEVIGAGQDQLPQDARPRQQRLLGELQGDGMLVARRRQRRLDQRLHCGRSGAEVRWDARVVKGRQNLMAWVYVCYRPVTPGLQGVRGLSDTTSKRAAASSRLDQNRCERRVNAYRFSVGVLEVAESLESLGKRDFLDRRHQQPHSRGQRTSSVILR